MGGNLKEVLARKTRHVTRLDIWVFGIILLGLGVLIGVFLYGFVKSLMIGEENRAMSCILGLLLFGGLFLYVLIIMIRDLYHDRNTPYELITFDGEKFNFANRVICSAEEIEKIRYEVRGRDYKKVNFGRLFITVHGKEYKFNDIVRLGYVTKRLQEIIAEQKEQNND